MLQKSNDIHEKGTQKARVEAARRNPNRNPSAEKEECACGELKAKDGTIFQPRFGSNGGVDFPFHGWQG